MWDSVADALECTHSSCSWHTRRGASFVPFFSFSLSRTFFVFFLRRAMDEKEGGGICGFLRIDLKWWRGIG